ncbi:MAG TPA: 30S ribosomal protein S5 [Spirochaetota bacterium]|jgi:small subunit ribosomal protein S5|nr:MAG: 30S ribosomal protein S5 [Spirochaetes bacterium ADurb.Bin218]HOK93172.1 30S ribosomal protein S5 [Spirochaetota bacterium]HON17189.1 30S ribosomal protein S5 [Spirochaetota bacterium]HOQ10751.1 30S ribosomal protein S5 [Spirochaetota bacterium]HOV08284.1 30S ribosomal protein S5 [Spirochaetota bacterium]
MKIKRRRVKIDGIELSDKVVVINRVAKVVKGGRRFSFNALSVVGDSDGHVGIGFGKANDVPDAIDKSKEDAKKNVYKINLNKTTIPHEVVGKFKSAKVIMKPAAPGTGIIAGPSVRAVLEKAGVSDILTKAQGSRNPMNLVKATLDGLLQLRSLKEAADVREVPISKLWE